MLGVQDEWVVNEVIQELGLEFTLIRREINEANTLRELAKVERALDEVKWKLWGVNMLASALRGQKMEVRDDELRETTSERVN